MDSIDTFWIGWTTFSTEEEAYTVAKAIIEKHLAFCLSIEPPVTSLYWWKGKVEEKKEIRLTLKFTGWKRSELTRFIHKIHPYENPEFIAVRIDELPEKYKSWALNSTNRVDR